MNLHQYLVGARDRRRQLFNVKHGYITETTESQRLHLLFHPVYVLNEHPNILLSARPKASSYRRGGASSMGDLPPLYWQPLFFLAGRFEIEEPTSHAVFDETLDEARNGLGAIPIPLQFAMDGIPRRRPPASLNDAL